MEIYIHKMASVHTNLLNEVNSGLKVQAKVNEGPLYTLTLVLLLL